MSTSPWHSTLSGTTWRCPAWDASSCTSRTRSGSTPRGCCASRRAVAAACCCTTSRSRSVTLGARRWRRWRRRCSWRSR